MTILKKYVLPFLKLTCSNLGHELVNQPLLGKRTAGVLQKLRTYIFPHTQTRFSKIPVMLSFAFPQIVFFFFFKEGSLHTYSSMWDKDKLVFILIKQLGICVKVWNDSGLQVKTQSTILPLDSVSAFQKTVSPGHMTQALKQMSGKREEEEEEEDNSWVYDYCYTVESKKVKTKSLEEGGDMKQSKMDGCKKKNWDRKSRKAEMVSRSVLQLSWVGSSYAGHMGLWPVIQN